MTSAKCKSKYKLNYNAFAYGKNNILLSILFTSENRQMYMYNSNWSIQCFTSNIFVLLLIFKEGKINIHIIVNTCTIIFHFYKHKFFQKLFFNDKNNCVRGISLCAKWLIHDTHFCTLISQMDPFSRYTVKSKQTAPNPCT